MGRRALWAVGGLVAGLASAGPAGAQTATLESVEVFPNLQTAEIRILMSGDPDETAELRVQYRPAGDTTWRTGAPPVRLDEREATAALFWLEPGASYEVRVTLQDGADADEAQAGFQTRAVPEPPADAAFVYVDAAAGRAGASGTRDDPYDTIGEAVANATAGTVILVASGTYHESVEVTVQGSRDAPLWIVGQDTGGGPPVLSGADEALESGTSAWRDEGGGVFSTELASRCTYLVVDDRRLYDYQSLSDLREENGNIGQPGVIRGGFFWDEPTSRLYVLLPDRTDPSGHQVHAAVRSRGLFAHGASFVFVRNLAFRYFPTAVDFRDCQDCGLLDSELRFVNHGVRIRGPDSRRNLVAGLSLFDEGPSYWPWHSCKHHTCEASGISITDGRDHVAMGNTIQGFFNGIYTGRWATTDRAIARNTDVIGNTILDIVDDGLEPEGACVQHKFVGNRVERAHNAVSLSPIETGPTWLVRNLLVSYRAHALKINNGPTGHTFVYHTTALPDPDQESAQAMEPSEPFGNFVFRNNIWGANRYVIEYIPSTLAGPVSMDYDLLWTTNLDGGSRFVKWLDERYGDIQAWSQATGLETHGLQAEPVFEDARAGDYTPAAESPGLDSGEILPGINDQDASGLPDMGAIERGGDAPTPPPGADAGPVTPPDGGLPREGRDGGLDRDGGGSGASTENGCGCRSGRVPAIWGLLALLWFGLRRRRTT